MPLADPSVGYPNADLAVTSMTATTTGGCLGTGHAYCEDSVSDFGATPSTWARGLLGEPDIFLVPMAAPVTLDAVRPNDHHARREVRHLCAGSQHLGCSDVDNVKALVYLADPAALSIQWSPVTNGQYVGNNGSADRGDCAGDGDALIGPLTFTAPTTGLGNGHRCILAAIQANGELYAPPINPMRRTQPGGPTKYAVRRPV